MSALGEMTVLISQLKDGRDSYTTTDIAEEISKQNPDLVTRWLEENTFVLLTSFISDRLRHERGKHRSLAQREAADSPMYERSFVITLDSRRRNLGAMTKEDHQFVADRYADDARRFRFHEDIHRLIAKKLNGKRTDEVFTEEQLESLFGQLDDPE